MCSQLFGTLCCVLYSSMCEPDFKQMPTLILNQLKMLDYLVEGKVYFSVMAKQASYMLLHAAGVLQKVDGGNGCGLT